MQVDILDSLEKSWEAREKGYIHTIYVELVNYCNQEMCPFCIGKEAYTQEVHHKIEKDDIDNLLDWMKDTSLFADKPKTIHLSGGEPLVNHSVLMYAIERIRDRYGNIKIVVGTNGHLLSQELSDFFYKQQIMFGLGLKPAKYSSDISQKNVQEFYYKNQTLLSSTTSRLLRLAIEKQDSEIIPEIIVVAEPWLLETDFVNILISQVFDVYSGFIKINDDVFRRGNQEYGELYFRGISDLIMEFVKQNRIEDIARFMNVDWMLRMERTRYGTSESDLTAITRVCNGGTGQICIASTGSIYSCVDVRWRKPHIIMGNLHNRELDRTVADTFIAKFSLGKNAKCRACDFVWDCSLAGCLASSYDEITEEICQRIRNYVGIGRQVVSKWTDDIKQAIQKSKKESYGRISPLPL